MAALTKKVEQALEEGVILMLGTNVLLGFQFRASLEPGFERLPPLSQYLQLGGLGLLLLSLALLVWPAAYHRIVEHGDASPAMHRFTTTVMGAALLPLALALGIGLYIATEKVLGMSAAILAGVAAVLTAIFFWYAPGALQRPGGAGGDRPGAPAGPDLSRAGESGCASPMGEEGALMSHQRSETDLADKIDHVLTEVRVILPGAQALLGFQLAAILLDGFDRLPALSKYLHLASLGLLALSAVLLMTPAAYHRIVERGEDTEQFHRFASLMLLAAMVPLALGIAANLFVVVDKVLGRPELALVATALALAVFFGLWFGHTTYRAAARRSRDQSPGATASGPPAGRTRRSEPAA